MPKKPLEKITNLVTVPRGTVARSPTKSPPKSEKNMLDLVEVHAHYRAFFNQFHPEMRVFAVEICGHFWVLRSDFDRIFGSHADHS